MAFTERQEYKVEVIPPYNILQIRRADIVEKDGVEVARSYHRHVLTPGSTYSAEPQVVQKIAAALWDAQAIAAYEASLPDPEPQPAPTPDPDPANLIPDNWSQDQRLAAMQELLDEYNANK